MALKDFNKYMKEPLAFPLNGKLYVVPSPSLEVGLKMTNIIKEDPDTATPIEEQWALVLGPAYQKMIKDNVPIEFVARAFLTAVADFNYGREMAEATWEVGTNPEAMTAYFQTKQAEKSKDSTSTDEAN